MGSDSSTIFPEAMGRPSMTTTDVGQGMTTAGRSETAPLVPDNPRGYLRRVDGNPPRRQRLYDHLDAIVGFC